MKAGRHFVAQCCRIIVFALTVLGFAWMTLGCGPGVVHVVSADSMAFQQTLQAELTADARRSAHLMGQWVRGSSSDKVGVLKDDRLPEPYTRDETRGVWPAEYHLGYAAQRIIREYYAASHLAYRVLEDGDIVEIVDEAGGNLGFINDWDKDRHPDIADVEGRVLFEVVPGGEGHRAAANNKVDWHLRVINSAMLGVPLFKLGTGYSGEVGVRFAEGAPPWKVTWSTAPGAPGVVQYRWLVLGAEKEKAEVYSDAYAESRWHEPTPREIVRFGRALHEVVERLVQAREELGRTRAAAEMPILPGKTMADYLRSWALWSVHDEGIARLLPVMREPPPSPPAQVRREARLFGQTVGGGGAGGLVVTGGPEGYDVKGKPGNQPWNFHMGNAAHKVIGTHYEVTHRPNLVFINDVNILAVVRKAGGTEALVRAHEALLKPDITDLSLRVVFQIKSKAEGQLKEAQAKVATDIAAINRAMAPGQQFTHGTGFAGEVHVRFRPGITTEPWRLKWETTAPGVVQYEWSKPDATDWSEESINKAINAGRWVDLTAADMQQYAEKLDQFVDNWVKRADLLRLLQMATDVVVMVVGGGAMIYVSPGLGAGKALRPAVSKQPPRIPVRTPPSQSGITPQSAKPQTVTGAHPPAGRPPQQASPPPH